MYRLEEAGIAGQDLHAPMAGDTACATGSACWPLRHERPNGKSEAKVTFTF